METLSASLHCEAAAPPVVHVYVPPTSAVNAPVYKVNAPGVIARFVGSNCVAAVSPDVYPVATTS